VDVEVCGVVRYCCELPLTQYPQVMQTESADLEALHQMTDGFSVDVLKVGSQSLYCGPLMVVHGSGDL
jgi:hypothetical protein